MSDPITICYKWTPEEYRRFELAQEIAGDGTKPAVSVRPVTDSSQGAPKPTMGFRKRLVASVAVCAVVAGALAVSAGLPGLNSAQAYSVAIGFVTMFAVPFGWAVFRKRTSVTFMSILAGVGCACMAPALTGFVPLDFAWPFYLGLVCVPAALILVGRVAVWMWQKRMLSRLRQQLCNSPEVRWEVDADGPNVRLDDSNRNTWNDIERVVQTSDGFLLVFQDKPTQTSAVLRSKRLFLWFPIHGFTAADGVARFASIAQAKVRQYEVTGPLPQVTTT